MNRWHVYEFMKRHYQTTGRELTFEQVQYHFPGLPKAEITEGIEEFKSLFVQG